MSSSNEFKDFFESMLDTIKRIDDYQSSRPVVLYISPGQLEDLKKLDPEFDFGCEFQPKITGDDSK